MEHELQLQKQLTCVTTEKLKGDFKASEKEMTVLRAVGNVQKERVELEAETNDLEAAAMRRQKEMLQEALRLEREMEEVVKQREIMVLEYEARRLKDFGQKRAAAVHQGGGIVGIEAVSRVNNRRGLQGEDASSAGVLVFGDLEPNRHILRPVVGNVAPSFGDFNPMAGKECVEGEIMHTMQEGMQTTCVNQAQRTASITGKDEENGHNEKDVKGRVVNRSMVVDLTNNSTFEVYHSDEDNSRMEPHNVPQEPQNISQGNLKEQPHIPQELQSCGVGSSNPNDWYEQVVGEVDDGLNQKEVVAQQEKILAQIRRENEAEVKTKELVAKLALDEEEEGDSKQVVAVKQDERPIGTDLSEFIVVAVKKRQMKMAKKSGGEALQNDLRKSQGEEEYVNHHGKNGETMAELEAEKKKACELVRQRTAATASSKVA